MIKGIGMDLIELDRIQASIDRNKRFIDRILTEKEKQTYLLLTSSKRKLEYIAGRFAAKEAFAKAVGTGIGQLSFQDIDVRADDYGAPFIVVKGYDHLTIFLTITHSRDYAAAQVVLEEK
ncbi:holo-ACP synthase [Oceanobacillus sp. FSL K6-2867]|uniref:holo-ACP synthase n=1 Tax=Oceanobacillus sp. FSL K6-2867 TaxID=2954748 RepID=UPI0030D7364C